MEHFEIILVEMSVRNKTFDNRPFSFHPFFLQFNFGYIIINQTEQVMLLSSPTRKQGWQLVSGALEAGETLLAGTLREVYEELG